MKAMINARCHGKRYTGKPTKDAKREQMKDRYPLRVWIDECAEITPEQFAAFDPASGPDSTVIVEVDSFHRFTLIPDEK